MNTGYPPGRLPLASKWRAAAPWITLRRNHMHTHPSPPSFRLIPELELTVDGVRSCVDANASMQDLTPLREPLRQFSRRHFILLDHRVVGQGADDAQSGAAQGLRPRQVIGALAQRRQFQVRGDEAGIEIDSLVQVLPGLIEIPPELGQLRQQKISVRCQRIDGQYLMA